jgi:hypothetical protein
MGMMPIGKPLQAAGHIQPGAAPKCQEAFEEEIESGGQGLD